MKVPQEPAAHLSGIGHGSVGMTDEHGAICAMGAGFNPIAGLKGDWMEAWDQSLVHPPAGDYFLKEGGERQYQRKIDDDIQNPEPEAFENVVRILHCW